MSTDNPKTSDQLTSVSTPAEVKEPVGAGTWDTPRTDVLTAEEVESILTGTAGFDPRNYEGPPVDSRGAFDYKPNVVHAEGLNEHGKDWKPPGNQSLPEYPPDSPAEAAALRQVDLASYAAPDPWENGLAHEHDRVWLGAAEKHPDPANCPPGYVDDSISGYGVPEGGLPGDGWKEVALGARNSVATGTDQVAATGEKASPTESALDAQEYNQGSQIRPRGWLHCYEFTQDHAVATGIATENTQYGEGGIPQMYIPNVKDAICKDAIGSDRPILVYVGQIPMTNTGASDRIKYR
jgi:hypothetical protein